MKVIGAGLPRTGTMSLQSALNHLGYRCYHMQEVPRNPGHVDTWFNFVTEKNDMDWSVLFAEYDATVDAPACFYYRELMDQFPDAKVILTVRDAESWYKSITTLWRTIRPLRPLGYVIPKFRKFMRMVEVMMEKFISARRDKDLLVEGFHRHNDRVRKTVPESRLLEYNVRDGWGPLCDFLECEVPEGLPFPHLNQGGSSARRKLLNAFARKSH